MKLPTWQPFLYSESPMKYYQDDCDRRPYTCSVFVFCSCLSLHTLPPFEHRNLLVCRRSTSLLSSYNALAWSMISYTPILGCRSKDFRVTIDHAPYIFWYLDENIAWGGVLPLSLLLIYDSLRGVESARISCLKCAEGLEPDWSPKFEFSRLLVCRVFSSLKFTVTNSQPSLFPIQAKVSREISMGVRAKILLWFPIPW